MPVRLPKVLRLGRRDWSDLLRAQIALLRAAYDVRRRPIGGLVARGSGGAGTVAGDALRARQIALGLERAAEYGLFRPFCLVRAIALRELLAREGISGSEIRVGVGQQRGRFVAHAWVRWGDTVLGDSPDHVSAFAEVNDLNVLRTR